MYVQYTIYICYVYTYFIVHAWKADAASTFNTRIKFPYRRVCCVVLCSRASADYKFKGYAAATAADPHSVFVPFFLQLFLYTIIYQKIEKKTYHVCLWMCSENFYFVHAHTHTHTKQQPRSIYTYEKKNAKIKRVSKVCSAPHIWAVCGGGPIRWWCFLRVVLTWCVCVGCGWGGHVYCNV